MPAWLSSLRDLIAEASPQRRLVLALWGVVPLAALAAAYMWFNPTEYRVLYTKLSDRASGEVITALEQLDIPYQLTRADGTIEVAADDLHAARYRLAAQGLPRSDADAEDAVERAPRFGASSLQEQQRYQHALETDLARSIQTLEAVELARVHLALPKVSPFLRDATPATAAVLLRLRPGAQLSAEQVTTLQTLVAAAVPRLKRSDVQVMDPRGLLLGGATAEQIPSPKRALEADLAARALSVLTPWLGADRVHVQMTVSLDPRATRQTVERVRNVVVGGQARPAEKTVSTTVIPEGGVQRIHATVILAFDASADERKRASQMTFQALGMDAARGDRVHVYALPTVPAVRTEPASPPVTSAEPARAGTIPAVSPTPPLAAPFRVSPLAALAGLGGALLLFLLVRRGRRQPESVPVQDDFDAALEAARSRTLADPRVTADVIKLWMRA